MRSARPLPDVRVTSVRAHAQVLDDLSPAHTLLALEVAEGAEALPIIEAVCAQFAWTRPLICVAADRVDADVARQLVDAGASHLFERQSFTPAQVTFVVHAAQGRGARLRPDDVTTRLNERERSALTSFLFDAIPDGIIFADPDRCIRLINRATTEIFGYTAEQFYGEPTALLYARHEDFEGTGASRYNKESTAPVEGYWVEYRRASGEVFPSETVGAPVRTEQGALLGYIGVIRDISERVEAERALAQQTERLRQSHAILERFAQIASHDMRSPVQAIRRLVTWILDEVDADTTDEVQRYTELLRARTTRLERMLSDLRAFVRAGQIEGDPVEVSMERVLADLREAADAAHLTLTYDGPPTVRALIEPLMTVLSECVDNTCKHASPTEQRPAHARLIIQPTEDAYAIFYEDNGPGIPAEFHERAFQIFATLQSRDEVEGTGVGLALVRRTMHALGGTVALESPITPEGDGLRLTIEWPRLPDVEAQNA